MKPSIGRIVHYRSYGTPGGEFASTCRAAIVTQVNDEHGISVGLCAINPTGLFFHEDCVEDQGNTDGGTWHWPERVED